MKTPKEILLGKHRDAEAGLDAIRERVVAEKLAEKDTGRAGWRVINPAFMVVKLWQELVWPCRRIWAGMAAVWVGILVFNYATEDHGTVMANLAPPTPEMMLTLKEQRLMMAQLLDAAPPQPATRPQVPGPRSEERQTVTAV